MMATKKYLSEIGLGVLWNTLKSYFQRKNFLITITSDNNTYTSNKLYSEIYTAYEEEKNIYLKYNNIIFQLDSYDSSMQRFYFKREYINNGVFINQFTINSSSAVTYNSTKLALDSELYKYSMIANIAYDNSVAGVYGDTAVRLYSKGDLFWYDEHSLGRAITNISTGDSLVLNTNYVITTVSDEFKRMPTIINNLIDDALSEYDNGDMLSYGNVNNG